MTTHQARPNALLLLLLAVLALLAMDHDIARAQGIVGQWSPPLNLFETEGRASEAEVIADPSGVVHVFWAYGAPGNEEAGASQAIYYARNDGDGWSEPVDILISPGGRVARMHAVLADMQGHLHIVWSGGDSIFYSRAYAPVAGNSRSWTPPTALASGAVDLMPAIALSPAGDLYVLWSQGGSGLMFVRSEDGGENWSEPKNIFVASGSKESAAQGRIAVDALGRLHVVFTYGVEDADPSSPNPHVRNPLYIYYFKSDDQGETWSDPLQVVPEPDFGEINVATFGDDVVHLVWNGRAGRRGRYHRWSQDGGETWSGVIEVVAPSPQNPVGDGGLSGFPALVTDATGALHMISATGGGDYYFRWKDGVWSSPILISAGLDGRGATGSKGGSLEQPSIALSEGNHLDVVFHDGFERIWYTGSPIDAPHQDAIMFTSAVATPPPPMALTPPTTSRPTTQPEPAPNLGATDVATMQPSAVTPLLVGIIPAALVVGTALVANRMRRRR